MKPTAHGIRIGAALALPISLAAGTVALAAWLFASDLRPAHHTPRTAGQVVVLDDLYGGCDCGAQSSLTPARDGKTTAL